MIKPRIRIGSRRMARCAFYCLLLIANAGCFVDEVTDTVQDVRVRVYDANTNTPIAGAKVLCESVEPPEMNRYFTNHATWRRQASDSSGELTLHLDATTLWCPAEEPRGSRLDPFRDVVTGSQVTLDINTADSSARLIGGLHEGGVVADERCAVHVLSVGKARLREVEKD